MTSKLGWWCMLGIIHFLKPIGFVARTTLVFVLRVYNFSYISFPVWSECSSLLLQLILDAVLYLGL